VGGEVGGQLEQAIGEEEDARPAAVLGGRETEILVHGQRREADIGAVEVVDHVGDGEQRQQPPRVPAQNPLVQRIHGASPLDALVLFVGVCAYSIIAGGRDVGGGVAGGGGARRTGEPPAPFSPPPSAPGAPTAPNPAVACAASVGGALMRATVVLSFTAVSNWQP